MGQISSVLSGISAASGALSSVDRIANLTSSGKEKLKEMQAQQNLAAAQLAERQKLTEELAEKKADRDRALLMAESEQEDRRRSQALRMAVSKQRAVQGAAGVGSETGGSGEAVLLGLVTRSTDEARDDEAIRDIRARIIDENLAALKAQNLLELTQLRAQQGLRQRLI